MTWQTRFLDDSGYRDMLKQENTEEARGRLENSKELVNVLSDREKYPSLAEFMEHVSLVMDKDDALDRTKSCSSLSTQPKVWNLTLSFCPAGKKGCFHTSAA